MTSAQEMLQERMKLFNDAMNFRKPKRTPMIANTFTWKIFDSDLNVKLSEATSDWDIMEKVMCEHHERYQFDAYLDYGTRNVNKLNNILGGLQHQINDETGAINAVDHVLMEGDEYDEYLANPTMFLWTKVAPRKFGELTIGQIQEAIIELGKFRAYDAKIKGIFQNKYGIPEVYKNYCQLPIETLFTGYRGIKEFSIDMRKRPNKIKDFVQASEPGFLAYVDKLLELPNTHYVCDLYSAFLAHSIMSVKQFEEFYWPTYKKVIDRLTAQGKTTYLFCEAEFLRIADFFQDVPKGTIILHVENDNIFEVRKKVPNICLAGGMPVDLLGKSTPQKCIDYAKMLIDEMGEGFVFSQNKMMSYKNDATRENMLAVNEFVRNYSG